MRIMALSASLVAILITGPAVAGHNNPWATPDDDLLMQYHDENLEQSVDTPGEDEMLGIMIQNASGKLDGSLTNSIGSHQGGGLRAGAGAGMQGRR